ncbi:hypothetical protein CHU98_g8356 [Xylaria longipes]|nr:hypothetical protein CHU98_g8356 [Xylaria longipes]
MSVGALEPQFYAALVKGLGLVHNGWDRTRWDRDTWPEMKAAFEAVFKSKTRSEWEKVFDGTDACCLPVLEYGELENDPAREGDQRPSVTLRETPCLAVDEKATDQKLQGQGAGVPGSGYEAYPLGLGEDGEEALKKWFGFSKDREFYVEKGGLALKPKLKL